MDRHKLHEHIREAGPVVYLDVYRVWGMVRYEQINAALKTETPYYGPAATQAEQYVAFME